MNWPSDQNTESQLTPAGEASLTPGAIAGISAAELLTGDPAGKPPSRDIRIGKRVALLGGKEIEVFTMTLGDETIELLPLKTWAQLDAFKWRVRGKIPGTPAGLEISPDHVKLQGETVQVNDPAACQKLERIFGEWLAFERESLELAKKKALAKSAVAAATPPPEEQVMRFRVELDKESQVHIHCVKGKETLATIGLNPAGFQSLVSQGFMRKPPGLKTGALHTWVEIDGVLYSFENGKDDSALLEQALNSTYLPPSALGRGKEIVVLANAASSTGFDLQFPAKVGGTTDSRRRPLGEESLELLQDADHCGLLQKGLVIKLSRPTLIFKRKTSEGGEEYLPPSPRNLVRISSEDGEEKTIDLSRPVNYLHLSAVELTAVFNHPAINRHAALDSQTAAGNQRAAGPPPAAPPIAVAPSPVKLASPIPAAPSPERSDVPMASIGKPSNLNSQPRQAAQPPPKPIARPNLWLKPILEKTPLRYDWLTSLLYEGIATWARNSTEGKFLDCKCWFISLGDVDDPDSADFRGVFLTEKGGFGLMSGGYMIRLEQGTAFIGTRDSELKDSDVRLDGFGFDVDGRLVLIVNDGYRSKFGLPEEIVAGKLNELKEHGAELMSIKEVLASPDAMDIVWTAPVDQACPAEPKALQSMRPGRPPD